MHSELQSTALSTAVFANTLSGKAPEPVVYGPRLALVAAQRCQRQLEALWGHVGIGLALVHAYHSDGKGRTADNLAVAAGVSEDTARRYLSKLANIDRVETFKSGRTTFYLCPSHLAERTLTILSAEPVAA